MTLTEFLAARLDEDEAVARAATEGPWYLDAPDHAYVGNRADGRNYGLWAIVHNGLWAIVHMSADVLPDLTDDAQRRTLADAEHMARHDPARVLREVEAKRAIVSEGAPEYLLVHLAAVYADHPDYRDEWRP
jgi:hypothetical protein